LSQRKKKYFPEMVSSSVIGRKWICDEDSRLQATGAFTWSGVKTKPKVIRRGSVLDSWLKDRPKSKDETKLRHRLDTLIERTSSVKTNINGETVQAYVWADKIGYGALRYFQNTGVVAHWDDFRCYWWRGRRKVLWLVEYKGVSAPNWIRWESGAAQSQVTIAQWVWQPIWRYLNWSCEEHNWVEFYLLKDSRFLERRELEWSPELAMKELKSAFDLYAGRRKPIPPNPVK